MKNDERLATGQIVSWNYTWHVCYRAGGNCLLISFADFMQIYSFGWRSADFLNDDDMLMRSIGVIGEISDTLEWCVGSFADKSQIVSTNHYIQEQRP